jgi:hypothetical protein
MACLLRNSRVAIHTYFDTKWLSGVHFGGKKMTQISFCVSSEIRPDTFTQVVQKWAIRHPPKIHRPCSEQAVYTAFTPHAERGF